MLNKVGLSDEISGAEEFVGVQCPKLEDPRLIHCPHFPLINVAAGSNK